MTTSLEAGGAPTPARGGATTALILGILGLICCQLFAPVAWYLGDKELKAIRAGQGPPESEGMAKAAMIIGIIGTCLLGFIVLWVVLFGGLGMLAAIMGN